MSMLGRLGKGREVRRQLGEKRQRLYHMAYAWTHDPALADDITQETMVKALKNGSQLRDLKALDKWLFGILANCWRDHFHRQKPTENLEELVLIDEFTPEHNHAQQHIVTHVRAAVSRLPEGQRQVLTLVDLEGFSYAEVAEILSVPMGTVMSRLCRARKELSRELLEINPRTEEESPRLRRVK